MGTLMVGKLYFPSSLVSECIILRLFYMLFEMHDLNIARVTSFFHVIVQVLM